ncbi:MAG TPA: hypothetical protein VHA33_29210 [Candidatus Angelobacter sp.]|jgi:hypothetical protein|nr:hypothetical protein [Candidatus Angelobacter sp.]
MSKYTKYSNRRDEIGPLDSRFRSRFQEVGRLIAPGYEKDFRPLKPFNFGKRPRMSNPFVGGIEDYITQPLYDSASFGPGAAMTQLNMFQLQRGQGGKTLAQTNMQQAGFLPNPQRFILRAIRLFTANGTVPTDLFNLLQNVSVEVVLGTKRYFQGPVLLLTAGCGAMVTAVAQLGTAPAGSAPSFSTSNGLPDQRSVMALNQPIVIEQTEPILVVLNPDTPFNFTAAGANPAGAGTTIYFILDGDLYRGVQ